MKSRESRPPKHTGSVIAAKIGVRKIADVAIIDIDGKVTIGDSARAVNAAVENLLEEGIRKFVLNLENVQYADSSGVGIFLASYTRVKQKEGQLTLLQPTKKVRELLAFTKLLTVFDCYDDEESALRSFK
jgi:anti-sigma B factor antagonist